MSSSIINTASSPQSTVEEEPRPRPVPPTHEDLLILARDDEFYWLQGSTYQTQAHQIDTSMVGQAQKLVEQGVVLADIPVGSIPGVGCMCYLVNLSGLRPRPPPSPPPSSEGRPTFDPPDVDPADPCLHEPAPAFDDLVIHDRTGTFFYWVKKCEYQRPDCRLDRGDPILEEQLRLLTNQGVVLADVPGGSLPGVDNMGCLVNLSAIHRLEAKEDLAKQPSTPQGGRQP